MPAQYLSTRPVRDQATIDRLSGNVPNPFQGLMPGTAFNGATIARQQLLRPFPHFTGITERSVPEGSSYMHMFQARVEKRFSHGVQFLANYLFAKTIERRSRLNEADPFPEKRISSDDRPMRFVASVNWDLPFRQGTRVGFWRARRGEPDDLGLDGEIRSTPCNRARRSDGAT